MKRWGLAMAGLIVCGLAFLSWYKNGYNAVIQRHERIQSSWAQVENQLQRRYDLIPNLVNTVKGFASQEQNILLEVSRLRSQWAQTQTISDKISTANQTSEVLSRLLLIVENYPELKSDQNFLLLQSQLEGTENRLAVERMRYNQAVQDFNTFIREFWGRFFASQTGLITPAVYFHSVEKAQEVPLVQF